MSPKISLLALVLALCHAAQSQAQCFECSCRREFEENVADAQLSVNFPYGVRAPAEVLIRGTPTSNAYRFSINFCGEGAGCALADDFLLHFDVRFDQNRAIVAYRDNNAWLAEEAASTFPFARGQRFEARIAVDAEKYSISANGQHLINYNHRLSISDIRHLTIFADVEDLWYEYVEPDNQVRAIALPNYGAATGGIIPGGIQAPANITITGQPFAPSASEVHVNLGVNGIGLDQDLPFVMVAYLTQNQVNFFYRQSGQWHSTESVASMPFSAGQRFELRIEVSGDAYRIYVDNAFFYEYTASIASLPPSTVQYLAVHGHVANVDVAYQESGRCGLI